ncbi:hypothetical protein SAMN05428957_103401 [Oryzisolibacter propanilivorax]|uniref:Uncharacterized protein n=1 Tax=Oryzisolibacter propanilivorax TaxID=1527607 RepID=A0A1G9RNZ3_9BURK|nr:hypothetical protein [Oryzisolibacter propanilivorax]SDM24996.1 hypothetical protein SAMN05428957_103401 [Oryzisolibacter propanilivorax]
MHSEVFVTLTPGAELRLDLQGAAPLEHEQARRWLDNEFLRLECEPLRASGKVLLADKVLVVAQAAGARQFADAAWAQQFARATVAALSRPVVRVDVPAMAVSF